MKRMRARVGGGDAEAAAAPGQVPAPAPASLLALAIRTLTIGLLACGLLLLAHLWPAHLLEGGGWNERSSLERSHLVASLVVALLVVPAISGAALALAQGLQWGMGALLLPLVLLAVGGYLALVAAAGEWHAAETLGLTLFIALALVQGVLLLQAYAASTPEALLPGGSAWCLVGLLVLIVVLAMAAGMGLPTLAVALLAWATLPLCAHLSRVAWLPITEQ